MTNTQTRPGVLVRGAGESLIDQIVRLVATRIDDKLLRSGARMPSIRQFAATHGVSAFTVVAGYDKLVANGYLESRRGAGFFVRERSALNTGVRAAASPNLHPAIDIVWLIRNTFRQMPSANTPGAGTLPADWMDADMLAHALRAVSRQSSKLLISYGAAQGFLPLRQQLQRKLAELEIAAAPEQFVTTVGVTQALDLVAREFTRPGDTVFVDDPAWYLMFGSFAALGLNVIGIPRLADGPDPAYLAAMAALHRPRLYVINSVLHNPSSGSLSASKAFQVLRLAEEYGFTIVEDDIYCDLHPGGAVQPATRLAALDQLQRVIYLGGFSKTLAPNLRLGFIATSNEWAIRLADRKMLATLSTSDIGERVVYKILSEGLYRKHLDRVRGRLDAVRGKALREMERTGLRIDMAPTTGMFVWADTGRDTVALAEEAMVSGLLLAPGCLFSPRQLPSTRTRLNIACFSEPGVVQFFERALA
jgi:DNA-binding transcriptional MocR family regulator